MVLGRYRSEEVDIVRCFFSILHYVLLYYIVFGYLDPYRVQKLNPTIPEAGASASFRLAALALLWLPPLDCRCIKTMGLYYRACYLDVDVDIDM